MPSASSVAANPENEQLTVLDYDSLYEEYQKGLVDNLRGFGPALHYLSLWVPSEDPEEGICNMLDAAAAAGQKSICVEIGRATLEKVDRPSFEKKVSLFGKASFESQGEGLRLIVHELVEPASKPTSTGANRESLPEASKNAAQADSKNTARVDVRTGLRPYDESIANFAKDAKHNRPPTKAKQEQSGTQLRTRVELCISKVEFWAWIDMQTHTLVEVGYTGELSESAKGSFEALCCEIEGQAIVEACEHGLIRTEFRLREHRDARPVSGIVLPRNAHPDFALLGDVLNKLRSQYSSLQALPDDYNEHFPDVRAAWRATSLEQKLKSINDALATFSKEHPDNKRRSEKERWRLSCDKLEFDIRAVIAFEGEMEAKHKASLAFELERFLRDSLEPRLELYFEELKDKNKLRRLAVIQPTEESGAQV